jgi:hypothetical protein
MLALAASNRRAHLQIAADFGRWRKDRHLPSEAIHSFLQPWYHAPGRYGVMRHETAKSPVFPTPVVMGLEQRLTYIFLLALALLLYRQSTEYLDQLPAVFWPAFFLIAILALESSRVTLPIDAPDAKGSSATPVGMVEPELASLPPEKVSNPIPAAPDTTGRNAVDCLGRQHANKLGFRLSPLVYGPVSEALAMIDAQFPHNSQNKVTRRNRAITLIGRELYSSAALGCSQKEFCIDVISEYEKLFTDRGLSKPALSFATYSKILAGTYETRKGRSSN